MLSCQGVKLRGNVSAVLFPSIFDTSEVQMAFLGDHHDPSSKALLS